jgi:hypothetical protein
MITRVTCLITVSFFLVFFFFIPAVVKNVAATDSNPLNSVVGVCRNLIFVSALQRAPSKADRYSMMT